MAEVTNKPIFEVLKQIQQRQDRFESKIDEIKSELNALRGYQISMQQDLQNVCSILGRFDVRFDRIENRLEIADASI